MKSSFDKSTESTRRFDALNVNKVLRYFYDMCQNSRFKKTNDALQTFTLTSVYVCDKVQYISPMTQITFFGFDHHYRILSHNNTRKMISYS